MFKGPRRAAVKGGSKAAGLAAIGAELALAYAQQAMEAANEAGRARRHGSRSSATPRASSAATRPPRRRGAARLRLPSPGRPAGGSPRQSATASTELQRLCNPLRTA
jgi:hypothetical protein